TGQVGSRLLLVPNVEALLGLGFELLRSPQTDAMLVENDARSRHDGGVVHELPGGAEILVEGRGAEEKHVSGVGEPFPAAAIGLELLGEPVVVTAGQVAQRAIVFAVGEA